MIPGRFLVHTFTLTVYHIFPPMSNERQDFPENAGFLSSFCPFFFSCEKKKGPKKKSKEGIAVGRQSLFVG
jgi:hypothetical protein